LLPQIQRPVEAGAPKLEDLDRHFGQVKADKGSGLDVLVVSAGFVEMVPMAALTPDHFNKTFAINARGAFFTVQRRFR
jgi:NAD(P)-dependent dehydrogenase (short-subunit alcohol dehydrogenase family)